MLPKKDHIIICNYNSRAEGIVEELHKSGTLKGKILLIATDENKEIEKLRDDYENFIFHKADPTRHEALKWINAHTATAVILLLDYDVADSDAKNALIALAVKKLEKEKRKDVKIVSELRRKERERHLKEAGVDEVVSSIDFSVGLLAQSALNPQISQIYKRLLSYSDDSNEFYYIHPGDYPVDFIGKPFNEIIALTREKTAGGNPALLVGVKRGETILLNPLDDVFGTLAPDDILIVMAYTPVKEI